MKKYKVVGSYTYNVYKIIEAESEEEAFDIGLNHSDDLCEWSEVDWEDSYREDVHFATLEDEQG